MAEKPEITIRAKGQEPLDVGPALYSNFLAVARVGGDIQFEFIFLDLNQIAQILESVQKGQSEPGAGMMEVTGKTVAKIVMPGASFLQIRQHMNKLFDVVEGLLKKAPEVEVEHGHSRTSTR